MTALILLSHGSRVDVSNQEMMSLADTMAKIDDVPFDSVHCAFQQFARPTFEAVVDELILKEIHNIVVFPLFLSKGNHVQIDVPEMIQAAKHRYPHVQMSVTPHLGGIKDLAAFLLKSIVRHLSADE